MDKPPPWWGGRKVEEPGAVGIGGGLPDVPGHRCRSPIPTHEAGAGLKGDSEVSLSFKTITLQIKWLTYNPHTDTGTV